jgi:hypothetical protein
MQQRPRGQTRINKNAKAAKRSQRIQKMQQRAEAKKKLLSGLVNREVGVIVDSKPFMNLIIE